MIAQPCCGGIFRHNRNCRQPFIDGQTLSSWPYGCATPFFRVFFIHRRRPAAPPIGKPSAYSSSAASFSRRAGRAGVWLPTRCRFPVSYSCRLTRPANPFAGCVPVGLFLFASACPCRFRIGRIRAVLCRIAVIRSAGACRSYWRAGVPHLHRIRSPLFLTSFH